MDSGSYKRAMREDRTAFEDGLKAGGIGYRLALTAATWPEELRAGDLLMLHTKWVNRNAGRCFVRHPLKVYFTDAEGVEKFGRTDPAFSQTDWVSGHEYSADTLLMTSNKLEPGTYDVRIAMVDAAGNPAIRLPVSGEDPQRRYRLGTIRILPARP
jgi:hypothetical protein